MGIASSVRELTQDIASSHEDRAKTLLGIREEAKHVTEDARDLIKGFETSRGKVAAQLRRDLARDKASNKSEVAEMLKGFGNSQVEEGAQMRKELAQTVAGRKSDIREMRRDFRQAQADVRADLREVKAAWQRLARTMQAKRATVEVPPKVEVPMLEEEVAGVPVEEQAPDLEAKLLAAIREHPEGITLAQVAESLGVLPIVLGRASRKLVDEGKTRKEDKDYFPVAGE